MNESHWENNIKEDDGLYAIDTIEKSVQRISARTFLAAWEVEKLMTAIAYQHTIPLIPSKAVASAMHSIIEMMESLVETTRLTPMEVRDLMITAC